MSRRIRCWCSSSSSLGVAWCPCCQPLAKLKAMEVTKICRPWRSQACSWNNGVIHVDRALVHSSADVERLPGIDRVQSRSDNPPVDVQCFKSWTQLSSMESHAPKAGRSKMLNSLHCQCSHGCCSHEWNHEMLKILSKRIEWRRDHSQPWAGPGLTSGTQPETENLLNCSSIPRAWNRRTMNPQFEPNGAFREPKATSWSERKETVRLWTIKVGVEDAEEAWKKIIQETCEKEKML